MLEREKQRRNSKSPNYIAIKLIKGSKLDIFLATTCFGNSSHLDVLATSFAARTSDQKMETVGLDYSRIDYE